MIALFARVGTSALKCAINIIRGSPWLQNVSPIVMMMAGAYHPLSERNSSKGTKNITCGNSVEFYLFW